MDCESNNYLLEVKTVQSSAFRILIEALKEILTDANLEFDSTGMKVMAMDQSHTVLVHLKLHSDKFETYFCKNKIIVGVNMINLFKLIKTMGNNETLTLYIEEENESLLGIRIDNSEKNSITKFKLNLMDLQEENIQIPPASFDSVITLPSQDFQKVCRDMYNIADDIEIKSLENQLIFSCNGEFA